MGDAFYNDDTYNYLMNDWNFNATLNCNTPELLIYEISRFSTYHNYIIDEDWKVVFMGKTKIIVDSMQKSNVFDVLNGKKVLDVGCNIGAFSFAISDIAKHVDAVDINDYGYVFDNILAHFSYPISFHHNNFFQSHKDFVADYVLFLGLFPQILNNFSMENVAERLSKTADEGVLLEYRGPYKDFSINTMIKQMLRFFGKVEFVFSKHKNNHFLYFYK